MPAEMPKKKSRVILPAGSSRATRTVFVLVVLALAIRVAVIPFLIGDILNPAREHWKFGWEEGRIARSIAAGEGFSSPLFGNTGKTAWTTPLYPYLLAGVFRLFGIYSSASAWVILTLNALLSALTCIPIYFIARRSFGAAAALWAASIWVFYPYAIYLAAGRVWGSCLDTLLMALLLWCTLALKQRECASLPRWVGYGFLWGVSALCNPVILSTLPFLLGWLAWRRRGVEWGFSAGVAILTLALTVAPWFVRNYVAFGRIIPFRSTFWMIFWESNTGDTSDLYPDWTNPAHNDTELEKYRRMGELGYVEEKRGMALNFLSCYPRLFLWVTLKRFLFAWTGYWSFSPTYLDQEPAEIPNIAFCTALTFVMLAGIRRACRVRREAAVPLLLVLFSFPLLHYITHTAVEYRHPLDPIVVVFIGVWTSAVAGRRAGVPELSRPVKA